MHIKVQPWGQAFRIISPFKIFTGNLQTTDLTGPDCHIVGGIFWHFHAEVHRHAAGASFCRSVMRGLLVAVAFDDETLKQITWARPSQRSGFQRKSNMVQRSHADKKSSHPNTKNARMHEASCKKGCDEHLARTKM